MPKFLFGIQLICLQIHCGVYIPPGADPGFDRGGGGGGGPDRDRPKTAILGPQFWCWGLIFGGQGGPGAPPGSAPDTA